MNIKINVLNKYVNTSFDGVIVLKSLTPYLTWEQAQKDTRQLQDMQQPFVTPLFVKDNYLCLAFFDGQQMIFQQAVFLNSTYNFNRANDYNIFMLNGVKCAMVVDCDLYHAETFRYLMLKGVRMVFSNAYINPADYNNNFIDFGAYSNIECNNMYGVFVNNNEAYALTTLARSVDGDGYVVRPTTEEFVCDMDFTTANKAQCLEIFGCFNKELYKKYNAQLTKQEVGIKDKVGIAIDKDSYAVSCEKIYKSSKLTYALGKLLSVGFCGGKATKLIDKLSRDKDKSPCVVDVIKQEIDYSNNSVVTVGAAQVKLRHFANKYKYVKYFDDLCRTAKENGAQLLTFPEYVGLTPLLSKNIARLLFKTSKNKSVDAVLGTYADFNADNPLGNIKQPDRSNALIRGLVRGLTPKVNAFYLTMLQALAAKYGLIISSGSLLNMRNGKIYNTSYLIDEKGTVLGSQDKCHPMEIELGVGIEYGDTLTTYDTSIGKVAMPICMDMSYFETYSILSSQGCQMVAYGIANMEDYDFYLAFRGGQLRSNEYPIYSIKSALVGQTLVGNFTGKAGVYAPHYLVSNTNRGSVVDADNCGIDMLIIAQIDLELLRHKDKYYTDTNVEFCKALCKLYA